MFTISSFSPGATRGLAAPEYFRTLARLIETAEVRDRDDKCHSLQDGIGAVIDRIGTLADERRTLYFIGNGGSASIASHCAIDYSKTLRIRARGFNDASQLTCLSNDLGYDNVFAASLELCAEPGDVLVAISSSGSSPNILNAVRVACERECDVATLSGFAADNPLRRLGDVNCWVPSSCYGHVEVAHQGLLHAILDLMVGVGSNG